MTLATTHPVRPRRILPSLLLRSLLGSVAVAPAGGRPLLQFDLPDVENFDTLAGSGTSAVLPAGWSLRETGAGANATYAAGSGSSGTGNTYSYGSSGSTERALGTLRSASVGPAFGVRLTNQTGAVVAGLEVAYTGEQWRLGAAGRTDRLDFAYSLDAAGLGAGTWVDVDALDFVAPVTAGAVGARVGNLAPYRVARSFRISGLNLAPGAGLMLRWSDFDAAGADDGLAIDDVAITARSGVPEALPPGGGALVLAGVMVLAAARRGLGFKTSP